MPLPSVDSVSQVPATACTAVGQEPHFLSLQCCLSNFWVERRNWWVLFFGFFLYLKQRDRYALHQLVYPLGSDSQDQIGLRAGVLELFHCFPRHIFKELDQKPAHPGAHGTLKSAQWCSFLVRRSLGSSRWWAECLASCPGAAGSISGFLPGPPPPCFSSLGSEPIFGRCLSVSVYLPFK